MRFACLVYFDPKSTFDGRPETNAVLEAAEADRQGLLRNGIVAEALTLPAEAVTIRIRDGRLSATDGPFMETKEMLAGFILIEARDLSEAVQIAAGIPFAKLGSVEVRPVVDFSKPRPTL